MTIKPTHEELEQKVKELEKERVKNFYSGTYW